MATRPAGGGTLTLGDRLRAATARQREEINKAPASTANMLSFRGGEMTLNDLKLGHEIPVIILAAQFERSYYPGAFVAGEAVVPSCYSRTAGDDAPPDEHAAFKQSELCKPCQWNQFESAREGTGKACKEGLKLALVHANNVVGGKNAAIKPMIVQARLSVLNAKIARSDLIAIQHQPNIDHTIQAYCTLTCESDAKSQYKIGIRFDGYTTQEVVEQLEPLIDVAEALLLEPYPKSMAIDPAEAAKTAKGKRAVKHY